MAATSTRPASSLNKRALARRRAEYLLEQERLEEQQRYGYKDDDGVEKSNNPDVLSSRRKPISESDLRNLVTQLDRRQSACFGIVKLSGWDLDQTFEVDAFVPPYLRNLWPVRCMTLLELAAWRNRDAILAALLRAGADPTKCFSDGVGQEWGKADEEDEQLEEKKVEHGERDKGGERGRGGATAAHQAAQFLRYEVREAMTMLPHAYAVWVVKQVVELRRQGHESRGKKMRMKGEDGENPTPAAEGAAVEAGSQCPATSSSSSITNRSITDACTTTATAVDDTNTNTDVGSSCAAGSSSTSTSSGDGGVLVDQQACCVCCGAAASGGGCPLGRGGSAAVVVVRWGGACRHAVCEGCLWRRFLSGAREDGGDARSGTLKRHRFAPGKCPPAFHRLRCPRCDAPLRGDEDDCTAASHGTAAQVHRGGASRAVSAPPRRSLHHDHHHDGDDDAVGTTDDAVGTTADAAAAAAKKRAASLRRFEKLPPSVEELQRLVAAIAALSVETDDEKKRRAALERRRKLRSMSPEERERLKRKEQEEKNEEEERVASDVQNDNGDHHRGDDFDTLRTAEPPTPPVSPGLRVPELVVLAASAERPAWVAHYLEGLQAAPGSAPDGNKSTNKNENNHSKKKTQQNQQQKKGKFRALNRREASGLLPGTVQATRSDAWLAAASRGDRDRLARLFELGVDVEVANEYGQNALMIAAWHGWGHYDAVEFLVHGAGMADVLLRGRNGGSTALDTAVANGHVRIAKLLRQALCMQNQPGEHKRDKSLSGAERVVAQGSVTKDTENGGAKEGRKKQDEENYIVAQDGANTGPPVAEKAPETECAAEVRLPERGATSSGASSEKNRRTPLLAVPEGRSSGGVQRHVTTLVPWNHPAPLGLGVCSGEFAAASDSTASRRRFHPGAGAAIIDGSFSEAFLQRLDALWATLPVAPPEKASCSSRSYYCDAEGWIREAIGRALQPPPPVAGDGEGEEEGGKLRRSDGGGGGGEGSGGGGADGEVVCSRALPHMRFLHYERAGGYLAPHVDLSRVDPFRPGRRSTHTFILYLTDCLTGGETALLETLPDCRPPCFQRQAPLPPPPTTPPPPPFFGAATGVERGRNQRGGKGERNAKPNVLAAVAPRRGRLLVFPHACPHEGCTVVDVPKVFLRGELI